MKIFFVRHGETDWNQRKKIQGQSDIELNVNGRNQAEQVSRLFEKMKVDKVFCSPLSRAMETSRIIVKNRCKICLNDLLKEINYGSDEGMNLDLIHGDPGCRLYSYFHDSANYIPPDGGETLKQLKERCLKFIEEEIFPLEGQCENILVVGHGAWIRGIISLVSNLDDSKFWLGKRQENCCVTIVECSKCKMKILGESLDIIGNTQDRGNFEKCL